MQSRNLGDINAHIQSNLHAPCETVLVKSISQFRSEFVLSCIRCELAKSNDSTLLGVDMFTALLNLSSRVCCDSARM